MKQMVKTAKIKTADGEDGKIKPDRHMKTQVIANEDDEINIQRYLNYKKKVNL